MGLVNHQMTESLVDLSILSHHFVCLEIRDVSEAREIPKETDLLVLVLYSHTGCGYLLAQLLHGWPWLH